MVDSEQQAESPAPDTGGDSPPPAPGGTPSPAPSRPRTAPPPTNGQLDDEFELRYASEARAELVSLLSTGPSVRNGDSDRIEVGKGYEEYGPQSYVQGTDRLDVGGNYTEHAGGDGITQSTRMSTTVQGHLNLKGKGDTGILGGTLVDTHVGPEFLAAGMSDDLVVGVGVRTTVAGDLHLCGLMGMEEKIGTAAMDGALVELYGMSFEREFGAGLHNSGAVTFSGPLFLTTASGFRPLLKAMTGPRNLTPGSGAPAGGASSSPPPAAPAAGDGGMLMDPAIASGAEGVAGAEDTEDARHLVVVADVHVDPPPARTAETADDLADAQRLADTSGEADAAQASADFFRRLEADGPLDQQRRLADAEAPDNRNLIVVEDASGERQMALADGNNYNDENWMDNFLEQQIDYPDTQHVDQAGDGANPPPAAVDGLPAPAGDGGPAPDDGPVYGPDPRYGPDFPERRYTDAQPRIHEDPLSYNYQEVADYAGGGRWDRLLSQDVQNVHDGHASHKMQVAKEQSLGHVDQVIADLIATDPGLYGPEKLDDYSSPSSRGDQFRRLNSLRDRFAAAGDDAQSLARAQAVQDAIDQINWGVHARLYPALEDAENAFVLRKPLADDLDQNLLTEMFTTRIRQLQDEWADLDALGLNRTAEETAQMQSASDELMAIQGALDEVRRGYDPLHFLDGMIDLRTSTYGPDGADEYKIVRLDVERMIDAMTPIRQGLADTDTTGVGLTRFDFKRVEDPEVLDVIRNNKGTLGDTHTRADTAADFLAAELKVGNSPQLDDLLESLKARKDELGEAPENAEQLAEIMPTLTLLEKHRANPYSLKPTEVEDLIHLELATLSNMPVTPENTARIAELNNALVTLDQRMRSIMGDGLLWADQVGTDPQKAVAVKDRATAAQTAWVFTQKSDSHMRVYLDTGSTYDLHLANMYDLAARDLRRNIDPADVLTGLGKAPNLDPEIQKAADAVEADLDSLATYEDASKLAFTPGVLADAKHRDGYRPYELDTALHLEEYWNPKAFSGDSIDPTKNGPRKWWKSLKGIKKRVGGAMLTMQGINTPDRYGRTWAQIMFETPEQSKARRLRSQQNRQMHAQALGLADNSRDATRQGMDLRPGQLVPDSDAELFREHQRLRDERFANVRVREQGPDLKRVREMDARYEAWKGEKHLALDARGIPPVGQKQQAMLDEMRKRADLAHDKSRDADQMYQRNLEDVRERFDLRQDHQINPEAEGFNNQRIRHQTEEDLWKKLAAHLAEGYDPRAAMQELRLHAIEVGLLENPAVMAGYDNVAAALRKLDADPDLQRVDYKQTMKWVDSDLRADLEASNMEAHAYLQKGREDATAAARDALVRHDPNDWSDPRDMRELNKMDFDEYIDRLRRIYDVARENDDTRKTREMSAAFDELDVVMRELGRQEDKAGAARFYANQPISNHYNKEQVLRRIDDVTDEAVFPAQKITGDTSEAIEQRRLASKNAGAWVSIRGRLKNQNIDPLRTAEDLLNGAYVRNDPESDIRLYQNIVDQVSGILKEPRSRNMAAFPDNVNRKLVIEDLRASGEKARLEQSELDVVDPGVPQSMEDQAARNRALQRYTELEYEINTYEELADLTHQGQNPVNVIESMRLDLEATGKTSEELATLRRIETDVKSMVQTPEGVFLAQGPDWVQHGRKQVLADLDAGHQASAAKMQEGLGQVDDYSKQSLLRFHPQADDPEVRQSIMETADYEQAREFLTALMNQASADGRHADAIEIRLEIDEMDTEAERIIGTFNKSANTRRQLNLRRTSDALKKADLDPDAGTRREAFGEKEKPDPDTGKKLDEEDYLKRIDAERRRVAAELEGMGEDHENYAALTQEAEVWETVYRRAENGYSPVATAEDHLAAAMVRLAGGGLVDDDILLPFQKVLDTVVIQIRPNVKRVDDPTSARPARLAKSASDVDPTWVDEPASSPQLVLNNALESGAFLDEVARRQDSGGMESVHEWVQQQGARLEELREGDGDLLVQPGGGARDLPPDWRPPDTVDNPQPILDSNGARWGDGGPVPDIDEAELPVVPVREKPKPVPDDAGAAPPPAGNKRPQPDDNPYDVADEPPLGPDDLGGAGPPPPDNKRPRPDNPYEPDLDDPPPLPAGKPPPPDNNRPRPDNPYEPDLDDPPPLPAGKPPPPDNNRPRPDNPYEPDLDDPPPLPEGKPPPPAGKKKPRPDSDYTEAMDDPPPIPEEKPPPPANKKRPKPADDYTDTIDDDALPLPDEAIYGQHRRPNREAPIFPADPDRRVSWHRRTDRINAVAQPPDSRSGGKHVVELDTNRPVHATVGEYGSIWGPDALDRITIFNRETEELMDPDEYIFIVGYVTHDPDHKGPPFVVTMILNGDLTRPGSHPLPPTDYSPMMDAAEARRTQIQTAPVVANPPPPGRLQDNLDAVLDAIPPPQLDDSGRAASPEAGGVFYPPPDTPSHRAPMPTPGGEQKSIQERYRWLREQHDYRPEAKWGTERGVDYVWAPPTAAVVPPPPRGDTGGYTLLLTAKQPKGGGLPQVRLGKPEQADILAGSTLRVRIGGPAPVSLAPGGAGNLRVRPPGGGGTNLGPGEYEVVIRSRGKTHRKVFTNDADLRSWVDSIRNPSK